MKIVIVNGSPRKGNTLTAIEAFIEGANGKDDLAGNNDAIVELKAIGEAI